MSISSPEASEIAIRKLDHVLSAGAGDLEMDEVKIITEHRDELAARLQKLLITEVKSLSSTTDLLQTTYSAAKAPLGKGENNERPQAANNPAGIDRDLLCSPHTNAEASNEFVPKCVGHD